MIINFHTRDPEEMISQWVDSMWSGCSVELGVSRGTKWDKEMNIHNPNSLLLVTPGVAGIVNSDIVSLGTRAFKDT